MTTIVLRGKKLFVNGVVRAEIFGHGGYGVRVDGVVVAIGETFHYFCDAVKWVRNHLTEMLAKESLESETDCTLVGGGLRSVPNKRSVTVRYETGSIKARDIDLDTIDFAVDTALSWDGDFPEAGKGDYLVSIGHVNGDEPEQVLVSRRYTGAVDAENAATIALDAFAERHDYERDDKGNILEVTVEEYGTGIPCWVERVDKVTS